MALTSSGDWRGYPGWGAASAQRQGSVRHSEVLGKPGPAATSGLSPEGKVLVTGKDWERPVAILLLRKEMTWYDLHLKKTGGCTSKD